MSSVICNKIKVSIFGESHGQVIGCVIDGLPAGVKLDLDSIYKDMARRAPGKDKTSTPRLEKDIPNIISGVIENVTTGAPLTMIIENTNVKSSDYENVMTVPRPSHSDYPAFVKYGGNNDKCKKICCFIDCSSFVRWISGRYYRSSRLVSGES